MMSNSFHSQKMKKTVILSLLAAALCCLSCQKKAPTPEVAKLTAEDTVALQTLESAFIREHHLEVSDNGLRPSLPYEDFYRWIASDPRTLSYPFDSLRAVSALIVQTSPDGRLRYYMCDDSTGEGSMRTCWCVRQLLNADGKVCVWGQPAEQVFVRRIICMEYDGAPAYLVSHFAQESWAYGAEWLEMYRVDADTLAQIPVSESLASFAPVEYNMHEWDSRTNGMSDGGSVFPYDAASQSVYLPLPLDSVRTLAGLPALEEDEKEDSDLPYRGCYSLTDRYDVYQWDGRQFVSKGQQAGYWLHPSLHDFMMLRQTLVTPDHNVRIDEMADGSFRYASWPKDSAMTAQPEIVVEGGSYDQGTHCYLFGNDGYTYIVADLTDEDFDDEDIALVIKKDGKSVLRQLRVNEDKD